MPNEEVQDYIKKQLEEGHTKQEIEEALINAGWAKEDINRAFRALSKNSNTSTSPHHKSGNKKSLAAAVAILLLLISAVSGGVLVLRGNDSGDESVEDLDIAEEVDEEEIKDEDESDEEEDAEEAESDEGDYMENDETEEITLSEADSCQEGQFEVDFILDDEFDIPLAGEMNFHGLKNEYCGISYSLDIPEEDWDEVEEMVINEFGLDGVEYLFDPHYIGEQNFCFMPEEYFPDFHQEIQEGVITDVRFADCFQNSIQSEDQFLEFRDVIANYHDGNYFGEFEWDVTAFLFLKFSFTEKIELMGSNDTGQCFYRSQSYNVEILEDSPSLSEKEKEDIIPQDSAYCIIPCNGAIDRLLKTRNPHQLSFNTLQNPDKLDYSETIEREDGSYQIIKYQTTMTNDIPCVHASEELIEKDPNIDSEEEIFEALSNHEEVQGDNSN